MTSTKYTNGHVKCNADLDCALHEIQVRRSKRKQEERNVDWYSWLISHHPFLVLFICSCIISASATVSVLFVKPPDFQEPSKGFEVRGTDLTNRINTWENIKSNTGFNSTLSNFPYVYAKHKALYESLKEANKQKQSNMTHHRTKRNVAYSWDFKTNGYFCTNPSSSYAKFVVETTTKDQSLWSVEKMLDICRLEKQLLNHYSYGDICSRQDIRSCCPTLSLPNYIVYLSGLSTCEDIEQKDIDFVHGLLTDCMPFYDSGNLTANCWDSNSYQSEESASQCAHIPTNCTRYNAVYSMFHYLIDIKYSKGLIQLKNDQKISQNLLYTSVFLPTPKGQHLKEIYYKGFEHNTLDATKYAVEVSSLDFGLKDSVFEDMLITDKLYPIIALCVIAVIVAFYTNSIFITIMGIISSISSLVIAYFLYSVIFDFAFFPFMNLMTIIVIVGIGADNIFVLCSAWMTTLEDDCRKSFVHKQQPLPNRIGVITKQTLQHAAKSMFVTGFTTACAFLSNFTSPVTAIRCFGIYAGLTVFSLLFLSVTWLPAALVISETRLKKLTLYLEKMFLCRTKKFGLNFCNYCRDICTVFFTKIQLILIIQYKYIWLIVCPLFAACGCLLIFVTPKLRLPETNANFQYFKPGHLFELYYLRHRDKFNFEKDHIVHMPARIVFGVLPTDNGDRLNPDDRGGLVYNNKFNMSLKSSQIWLKNFCEKVQNQSFVKRDDDYSYGTYKMCFIFPFIKWMESRECFEDSVNQRPCCRNYKFPYSPRVFDLCLKKAVVQLSQSPNVHLDNDSPGPRFDANDTVRSVILEFPTIQNYLGGYEEMDLFYNNINQWMVEEFKNAPEGMRGGWFVTDLEFYSLQKGLYHGTLVAIGISICVVFVAMLITTRNLVMTILTNLSITMAIFTTIGCLVLMQWELNILESVTISIAIGLSVDFTVHYGVAYLVSPNYDRLSRVEYSCTKMGPAITLAALTTFVAGLCMIPAQVVVYYKFGVFLMVVMFCSWFYGTYFFLSVCGLCGPGKNFGSLSCLLKCCFAKKSKHKNTVCSKALKDNSSSPQSAVIEVSIKDYDS